MTRLFKWLAGAISPLRSHLFAMVGVVAVAGIGAAFIAWAHIRAQNATIEAQSGRIGDLVEVNQDWARWADKQQKIRDLEQENTRLLQEHLALIETRSAEQSEQLKKLEASNAEVKALLATRLPAELRRLLEQR